MESFNEERFYGGVTKKPGLHVLLILIGQLWEMKERDEGRRSFVLC